MQEESILDLIAQATCMYKERCEMEQDLIYYVAKLPDLDRSALILAYQNMRADEQST
jgi:hypothetical protein